MAHSPPVRLRNHFVKKDINKMGPYRGKAGVDVVRD